MNVIFGLLLHLMGKCRCKVFVTNSKTIQRKPSVIDCQSGGYRRPVPLRDGHRTVAVLFDIFPDF